MHPDLMIICPQIVYPCISLPVPCNYSMLPQHNQNCIAISNWQVTSTWQTMSATHLRKGGFENVVVVKDPAFPAQRGLQIRQEFCQVLHFLVQGFWSGRVVLRVAPRHQAV